MNQLIHDLYTEIISHLSCSYRLQSSQINRVIRRNLLQSTSTYLIAAKNGDLFNIARYKPNQLEMVKGLYESARGRNLETVKFFESRLIGTFINWQIVAEIASETGHLQMFLYAHKKNNNYPSPYVYLPGLCSRGYLDIVEHLVKHNMVPLDDVLRLLCQYNRIEYAQIIIDLNKADIDIGLAGACCGGNLDTVDWIISKGANNWNLGLKYACRFKQSQCVEYMIDKGATVCLNCFVPIYQHPLEFSDEY